MFKIVFLMVFFVYSHFLMERNFAFKVFLTSIFFSVYELANVFRGRGITLKFTKTQLHSAIFR